MRYLGGKARVGKQVAAVIQSIHPVIGTYWEPFCGMCSVMERIKAEQRIATDAHPDLILLWRALQSGWVPPKNVTEEEFKRLKYEEPSPLRGFAGFGCSHSGDWFHGYAKDATGRNYALNAYNGVLRKIVNLQDVEFSNEDYHTRHASGYVIYCDPPYAGANGYSVGEFDSDEFWAWVRRTSSDNSVYVSEYKAPPDFKVIWEKTVKTDVKAADRSKYVRTERLFTLSTG